MLMGDNNRSSWRSYGQQYSDLLFFESRDITIIIIIIIIIITITKL